MKLKKLFGKWIKLATFKTINLLHNYKQKKLKKLNSQPSLLHATRPTYLRDG
jgi:hypothetical protein